MNRQEAVTQIAQYCVLSLQQDTIGVLLPTMIDTKSFQAEVVDKLNEVPEWLECGLTVCTMRHLQTKRGASIRFLHNVNHARGLNFDYFYVSSRLEGDQLTQYVFALMPILSSSGQNKIVTFDD